MTALTGKFGVWTNDTSQSLGHLHEMQNLGFEYLVVRLVNRNGQHTVPTQAANLSQLISDAATINFPIAVWSYIYPDYIQNQIDGISNALPAGIEHIILDAEKEWENEDPDLAHQLLHGIAEAIGHRANLHLSSFCNPNDHPLPLEAFLEHCQSFMPQAYQIGNTPTSKVMDRVYHQCVQPTTNSLGHLLIPTINKPVMLQLMRDRKFAGVNVWLWEDDGGDPGVEPRQESWKQPIQDYFTWLNS